MELKLTPKQKAFCEYYAASGNAFEAARCAGYKKPHPQGAENLQKPTIQEYIKELTQDAASKRIATAEQRQEFWTRVMRGEEKDVIYIDGVEVEVKPSLKERLKAAELLGKAHGDFLERREITGKDGAPLIPEMTDAERSARIAGLIALAQSRASDDSSED